MKKTPKKHTKILQSLKTLDHHKYDPNDAKIILKEATQNKYSKEIKDEVFQVLFRLLERFRKDTQNPKLSTTIFSFFENYLEPPLAYKLLPFLQPIKNVVDLRLMSLNYISKLGTNLPENLQDQIIRVYFAAIDKSHDADERAIAFEACKTLYTINHPQKKIILKDIENKFPTMGKKIRKELSQNGIEVE